MKTCNICYGKLDNDESCSICDLRHQAISEKQKQSVRRNKTQRKINQRKYVYKNIWQNPEPDKMADGRFDKWNLTCGCPICKKPRYSRKVKHAPAYY